MTGPPVEPPTLGRALIAAGVLLFAIAGALSGALETLLVPLRFDAMLVPIAIPLAIGSNIALPILSRRLNDTSAAAIPPVAAWIVTVVVLAGSRPEGDILLPGGKSNLLYVSYGMLIGGLAAGVATVTLTSLRRPRQSLPLRSRPARSGSGNGDAR
jgi:hypothetical protein